MFFKMSLAFLLTATTAQADCLKDPSKLFAQGEASFKRRQYLLATTYFSTYSLITCSSEQESRGRLRWAESLFELGENAEADTVLVDQKIPAAKIMRAWYQPDLVPTLPTEERARFSRLQTELDQMPRLKNPWIAAGASAVLPGAGQFYNGNYQSGLYSFVLNALFLSATLSFVDKKMDGAAITSATLFSVVYVGTISGSANASRAINDQARSGKKTELKGSLFPELTF